MLIKMLKTQNGVNDGEIYHNTFFAGEVYGIGKDLYRAFSGMGIIEDIKEEKIEQEQKPEQEPGQDKKTNKKRGVK